ncbi:MAG: transglycosylase domain-containing protein [Agathobacter sp.]|nr:transglycosylase domain-containing protein [Agathobacter sp.]
MTYNKSSTKKRIKHANSKKTKIKNKLGLTGLQIAMIAFIVIVVIVCSALLGIAKGIIDSAPDISKIDVVPTGFSTSVLADDGVTEITTLVGSGANREYVKLDRIPDHMQQAFVAIEDERFYEHNGIDLQSIARAGVATIQKLLTGSGSIQGGSTITQQLIKNNVLTSWTGEKNMLEKIQRKLQEQYLALKLEEQVNDKDWILENYLNTINLGSNTLGVQSAANKYFGKDVSELTLSESAVIAGITQNPYGYDPIRFPEKNAERRERVLNNMLEQKYITKTQYDEALADPVYDRISSYNVDTSSSYNSYFVDALIEDVLDDLIHKAGYTESDAYKAIYHGGLTIVSTQDLNIQKICDEEVNNQKNYVAKPKYSFHMSFSVKKADGTTKTYTHQTMLSYYRKQSSSGTEFSINYPTEEACYSAIKKYQTDILEEGDVIVEGTESIHITLQPQVAMTVIDQSTGEVKALVGGRGDKSGNRTWNRATDTKRQPGSTFKILSCYAAALDSAGKTLASVQDDAPLKAGDKEYKNDLEDEFYGLTTMREAIRHSHNITALKFAQEIGINLCYEYATKFGFSSLTESDKTLSLPLGGLTNGVTNLELAAAYASIANEGEYIEPSFYTAVYDHEGNLILDNATQEQYRVISEETAWLLTEAMRDVMTLGTGREAYFGSTMEQAGKSGTTTACRDILFAGYTPYYTAVIWGGHDDNTAQVPAERGYVRAIWKVAMQRIHANLEYKEFKMPSSITTADVCIMSGLSPLEDACEFCQKGNAIYEEYFAIGTTPTETCNHHITLDICSETGMIASANCPDSKIIQKVFIIDANPETQDSAYIATEEFLSTICTHKSGNDDTAEANDLDD